MTDAKPRSTADLAQMLGVKPATIRRYRVADRYADHPFPAPDGHIGIGPYWSAHRDQEILDWAAARVGKGVGGGRPKAQQVHHLDGDPRNNAPANLELRDQAND